MKIIAKKEFESNLYLEYSSTPTPTPLGKGKSEMNLYMNEDNTKGFIEWYYELEDEESDVVEIGLWFDENKSLTDYDGVFSLNLEAINLLEENGFNCDYAK
jgi:hypothetical protein